MGISVITPTGMRQQTFRLAELFMARQTYTGDVQWIVVDDGAVPTVCTQGQEYIRPLELWHEGQNTQARNLSLAIPYARYDKIVFWEDDDYYAPEWLAVCSARLDQGYALVAEQRTKYYHVPNRRYHISANETHGSMCQTAMRPEVLEPLLGLCNIKPAIRFLDLVLWQDCAQRYKSKIFPQTNYCVGMKGLPGRTGIGIGHKGEGRNWRGDPNMEILREWIGNDVEYYRAGIWSMAN